MLRILLTVVVLHSAVFFFVACGKSTSLGLPQLTPPVKVAVPSVLTASSSSVSLFSQPFASPLLLGASDIQQRFFGAGPTNIFGILTSIDSTIANLNSLTGPCTSQVPVPYSVAPFGSTVSLYGQCANTGTPTPSNPALTQFGSNNNNIYFYVASAAQRMAAVATPVDASGAVVNASTAAPTTATPISSSTYYQVEAWIGVGYGNSPSWDSGSYGAIHLVANSATKAFEMTVAGTGFGYCGFQIKSDGANVYAKGSTDMGTTCNAVDTLCLSASNLSTTGTCGAGLTTFALTPLGRNAYTTSAGASNAASMYPGNTSNNITLTGATGDSVYFGPTTATTGLGALGH